MWISFGALKSYFQCITSLSQTTLQHCQEQCFKGCHSSSAYHQKCSRNCKLFSRYWGSLIQSCADQCTEGTSLLGTLAFPFATGFRMKDFSGVYQDNFEVSCVRIILNVWNFQSTRELFVKRFHERNIEALVSSAAAILDLNYEFLWCLHSDKDFENLPILLLVFEHSKLQTIKTVISIMPIKLPSKQHACTHTCMKCSEDNSKIRNGRYCSTFHTRRKLSNSQFSVSFCFSVKNFRIIWLKTPR